ncbi:hypothetical protein [Fusobacterium sp.]|uniref:hypothetical protein n=1 Tax=Fusobacterium sp. TaxID=68766 RepID=UPI002630096F|nr:hypothetical protein [Fusobacterium sp.]
MKKLALLLAALGVVSAATYAAPELTVTSIGQEVEIEHTNGTDDTTAWLYNRVGLAYENWTIGFEGAKQWAYSDKNDDVNSSRGRIQFDVWNKVNDDLKLGFRYRGEDDFERFYGRYDYSHGMFLSSGDFWYQFNDGTNDVLRAEWFPIGAKFGPVTVKYMLDYTKTLGDTSIVEDNKLTKYEDSLAQQIRIYAPLYQSGKLTLSTEGRFNITEDKNYEKPTPHRNYDDFGRNRIYLKANYAMTESLNVYANYAYEFRKWDLKDGHTDDVTEKYYQNFTFGWSYRF